MKTACIDGWVSESGQPALGGTCLNVGCIPSKALLDSSHHYQHIATQAVEHGIQIGDVHIDVGAMMKRKDRVVRTLTQGISGLFTKNEIDWLQGDARLTGPLEVEITPNGKHPSRKTTVSAEHIIIATGSVPAALPQASVDQKFIVDSTGALALTEVPGRLGVIGAGVIGLELGSVWRRLGSEVLVLEALDSFLPAVDQEVAKAAFKTLTRQGLEIRLGARVTSTKLADGKVDVHYEQEGESHTTAVDKLIVAVGRKPNTKHLNVETLGIELDAGGFIVVDGYCRTRLPNVYAIGDVVRGPMLAHKASEEGIAVAEHIAGRSTSVNHETIPWVIYTWPEIAWVGKTEQEMNIAEHEIRSGVFPFTASGRARAMGETDGLVKIIADGASDRLLGVHIFGPNASELITEAVLTMEFDGNTEDIARTVHAHPTLAEALHEAALAADRRALHI
jgi:dihydrolipoamide dehydrogenase